MKQLKICVIGVYFGQFPKYIGLWQRSCEFNKEIDFLIVTDSFLPYECKNVKILRMSLRDFRMLAESKLDTQICLDTPFKCCDYKPLYGYIFQDYLKDYDYWGFCDFDMLFGDILNFVKKYQLQKYDKFLTLGHFSLIRNTEEVNRLPIINIPGSTFIQMIQSPTTIQFDELSGGVNDIFELNERKIFRHRIFADISRLWKRIKLAERYIDSEDVNYKEQLFFWQEGKCFRAFIDDEVIKNEEYLYIHLKKRKYVIANENISSVRHITITPDSLKMYKNLPNIDKDYIITNNPFRGCLYEYIEEKFLSKRVNHIQPSNK